MFALTGILLGLSTLVFIGPVLFYLISASVKDGFKAGLAVALGIILGDAIYVGLVYYGIGDFFNDPDYQRWMMIGSAVLIGGMGIKNLLTKSATIAEQSKKAGSILGHFAKGFALNFINPFVFAVWVFFLNYNQERYGDTQVLLSLILTLVVIFSTDCIKAYYATKLNRWLSPERLVKFNKVIGILFLLFAARFAYLAW